ncbi:peptidase domain-containing ABC transporter [Streptomonospora sp. PA3]|uniref:peptidase domain-containing ABC transporter n=1 Tax=Streptomonospora sp. PA3 TaxID=2607326 RepID=UPI0012DDD729|nr:peptidase domain-containing ABC transporter [Streptomonospora sp. PA3]MUL42620.1 peptidase domain-containing ABC transporter [Streptomonospora sp. PA3]
MRLRRVRRVREVQQFASSECGLCCIAMVLSAYGSRNTVPGLRRSHETGRDGLSIKDIVTILRERGMEVKTYRASAGRLNALRLPLIAYWDDNHVVVLEEITDRHATVVDPAGGRRRYSRAEFEEHFGGLVVEAVPTADYTPERAREPSVWAKFLRAAARHRRPLATAFAMSLLLYGFTLAVPIAVQTAINGYADFFAGSPPALLGLVVAVPMAGYAAVSLLRAVSLAAVIRGLGEAMMGSTFTTLLRLPYKFFANRSQGELLYRLSSISSVRDMISNQLPVVLLDLGSLVVVFGYIFSRSAVLGAAAMALFGCMVAVAALSYRPIRKATDREISASAESSTLQMEALNSIETLKVTGMTGPFTRDWRQVYGRALDHTRRRIVLQGAASSGYAVFQTFGPLMVLLLGLWLVYTGRLDLGSAVAVQTLTATSLGAVMSLSTAFNQLITANAQVERVGDIVNQPQGEPVFGDREVRVRGALSVRGMRFTYPGAKTPVLEDVSFEAPAGARVAVVGSTGSGKSTLGRLLMGLYPPDSGSVCYDGVPIGDIAPDSFYRAVAYVPQEISLSNRTIAENIAFGLPETDLDAVREAARRAQIHHEIEALPMGYQTPVREMGSSLSGGQRQRIALARALAREPRVLVLDEATSALDTVTESAIAETLNGLECTRVIIAHRLSTVAGADLIVVLQEGRVVQTGRHADLVSVPGPYHALVRSQVDAGAA